MDDQRDRRRADAVEDPRHPGEAAKMDVSRAERSDDQKIRQYECPSADPCPPEPAAQLRDEKADSPLLGKKAKKSVEMCDVGHTWKKIYLDLTGILRLPDGCIARIVPFERFGRRQKSEDARCYPLRAGLMEPQTTSPLPPTEEQARIRRLRLRPPMTRKELGRALWAPLGL